MRLIPREHGAYGQLGFPLVTAYLAAGVSVPAALIGVAAVAALLAHEPAVVLLGRRGTRARREHGRRAARWLAVHGTIAAAAGGAAIWLLPAPIRSAVLLPVLPAAILSGALILNREKSAAGEIAVALALSWLAVPVALAAGGSMRTAASIGLVFAAIFVAATLAVRAVLLDTRGGGDPAAARAMRIAAVGVSVAAATGMALASAQNVLPWSATLAALPGLGLAGTIAWMQGASKRLRSIGWALVASAAAATIILVAGLRG